MGTAGAFLGYIEVIVKVDATVGAGIDTFPATGALGRVNDNQPVRPLVYPAFNRTCRNTRGMVTVHTQDREI